MVPCKGTANGHTIGFCWQTQERTTSCVVLCLHVCIIDFGSERVNTRHPICKSLLKRTLDCNRLSCSNFIVVLEYIVTFKILLSPLQLHPPPLKILFTIHITIFIFSVDCLWTSFPFFCPSASASPPASSSCSSFSGLLDGDSFSSSSTDLDLDLSFSLDWERDLDLRDLECDRERDEEWWRFFGDLERDLEWLREREWLLFWEEDNSFLGEYYDFYQNVNLSHLSMDEENLSLQIQLPLIASCTMINNSVQQWICIMGGHKQSPMFWPEITD